MSITIKQLDNSSVTPKDDAVMYAMMLSGDYGKIYGLAVTSLGSNQIHVAAGRLIVKGREIVIDEDTISVVLSTSGTKKGQLYLHIDLSNTTTPVSWVSEAVDTLTALTQDDEFNYSNGIWDVQFCTYSVSETAVSDLVVTLQELTPMKTELANINSKLKYNPDWANKSNISFDASASFTASDNGCAILTFTSGTAGTWCAINIGAAATLSAYVLLATIPVVNGFACMSVPLSSGDKLYVAGGSLTKAIFVPHKVYSL